MEKAFGTISGIVNNLQENESLRKAVVFAAWKQAAGENLKERAVAFDLAGSRLLVAVEDQTWKNQMEALARDLLASVNSHLNGPSVRYLEFHVDPSKFGSHG